MKRVAKFLAWMAGTIALLLIVTLVVLMNVDWNRAKPWVEARASAGLRRPLEIRGDLRVTWEREGIFPHPFVTASDVHIGPAPNCCPSSPIA